MKIYIDEAGRGPLAGPLALGAIINLGKERLNNPLFKDSKLLSAKKREEACFNLYQLQQQGNILIAKSMISPQTIDRYGVTQSLQLGILKILYTLLSQLLDETPQSRYQLSDIQELIGRWNQSREKIQLIIDGNSDFWLGKLLELETTPIIDGDAMIPEISMASILAKVARDEYMQQLPPRFKKYRFEQHKGYGTKLHYELLQQHGISSLHRKRFLNRDWATPLKKALRKKHYLISKA